MKWREKKSIRYRVQTLVIKILKELSKKFNKKIARIKKNQSEVWNTITKKGVKR